MDQHIKNQWKKIQEEYSADIKNSPYFKFYKNAFDKNDKEVMLAIANNTPTFLPYAIDGETRYPMVASRYGYKTEEEALKRIEQLKRYPRWKDVDKFEIDVIFGDYTVDQIGV